MIKLDVVTDLARKRKEEKEEKKKKEKEIGSDREITVNGTPSFVSWRITENELLMEATTNGCNENATAHAAKGNINCTRSGVKDHVERNNAGMKTGTMRTRRKSIVVSGGCLKH